MRGIPSFCAKGAAAPVVAESSPLAGQFQKVDSATPPVGSAQNDGKAGSSAGFTLIELLVVVAVLSAIALAASGLMLEDRARLRFDDTHNRLLVLRRAVLGTQTPVYGGTEIRLSGFVADNGRLPENLRELLEKPGGSAGQAGVVPVFSSTINDECVQTGAGTQTPLGEAARLLKGHRGNYLTETARDGVLRDGWGNVGQGDDAINFGWEFTSAAGALTIVSLGADNTAGCVSASGGVCATGMEPEADQTMTITAADGFVPLDGWQVTLKNTGEDEITASAAYGVSVSHFGQIGLTLLVFKNTATGGQWQQFRSTSNSCTSATDKLAPGETCVIGFAEEVNCDASHKIPAAVPQGRHVLALTAGHNLPSLSLPEMSKRQIVTQVDFYPGAIQPNLVREIRPETPP
jgi:prepilin-type N-terminal cleavage/methylation domain-containing protein